MCVTLSVARRPLALLALLLTTVSVSCSDPVTDPGAATLQGLVTVGPLTPVPDAVVEAGELSAVTDLKGEYTLEGVLAGTITVTAAAPWLQTGSRAVTTLAGQRTIQDLQLEEMPLKVEPADRALMEQYHQTFDWTTAQLAITLAASPTRRALDNAIFHRNPALFVDTSGEAPLTPDPLPAIDGAGGTGLRFLLSSGEHAGADALVAASAADSLDALPLSEAEQQEVLTWRPALNFLLTLDPVAAAGLNAVDKAVSGEDWGGTPDRAAQRLERVYLHGEELWVEVVFEPFLSTGAGISDSDGDGFKELFARVDPLHTTPAQLETLRQEYMAPTYSTLGLRDIVSAAESALYSSSSPQVIGIIGEPYEVPGLGTISYPFVVLQAGANQKTSAILVAP